MKKQLLLLSALCTAGMASAQSSVTIFGVVDATLARGTGSVADRTSMLRGGLTSNRLGFRGVEDLGGGMKASFWLEAGMNVDDGEGQATNSNNQPSGVGAAVAGRQGLTFARRSTVSLAGNWGEMRLGRDFVPQYNNLVAGDPFGNVGVGSSINFTNIITGVASTRASNQIGYFSPNFAGFTVNVGHYRGENAENGAATDKDGTGSGIRVNYKRGELFLGAAHGRTKYAAGDTSQTNFHAGYDFGRVELIGTYSRDKSGATAARGGSFGALIPVGPGVIRVAYSQYKMTTGAVSMDPKKYAVGYVHNLSKRTALYGTYAHVQNRGGSATALNGATTAANASSNGIDLGIRHSF